MSDRGGTRAEREKAFEAARAALVAGHGPFAFDAAAKALQAAHSPTLGLDRSVCLRDVVELLHNPPDELVADQARVAFGGNFAKPNSLQAEGMVRQMDQLAYYLEFAFGRPSP